MRYSPRSSVTVVLIFSVRAGLAASTVTPGRTAPDVSFTVPATVAALVPCADAAAGTSRRYASNPKHTLFTRPISVLLQVRPHPCPEVLRSSLQNTGESDQ